MNNGIESENGLKISRNAPCPCGSGTKYKLCCGAEKIAAEREKQAKKSRFWVPEGVKSEPDRTPIDWPNDRPRWTMPIELSEEDETSDAEKVIDGLVRPYYERYCDMDDIAEGDDQYEIGILDVRAEGDVDLASTPFLTLAKRCQLWDVLKKKMADHFYDFESIDLQCEVRWDHQFGGPIITLYPALDDDDVVTLLVTKPRRFGVDDD